MTLRLTVMIAETSKTSRVGAPKKDTHSQSFMGQSHSILEPPEQSPSPNSFFLALPIPSLTFSSSMHLEVPPCSVPQLLHQYKWKKHIAW